MIRPLHKELHSPERQEIELRAEEFELESVRHERHVVHLAIASGILFGILVVGGAMLAIAAVL